MRYGLLLLAVAVVAAAAVAFTGVPDFVAVKADEAACAIDDDTCGNEPGTAQRTRPPATRPAPPPGGDAAGDPPARPPAARPDGRGASGTVRPAPGDPARSRLNALTVAAEADGDGYDRERFPHWSDQGKGCTTRDVVLNRDGADVRRGSDCAPTSGRWKSPYDGRTWTEPGDVDIDHMVPLKEAWVSGAAEWSTGRRELFANDLRHHQLWSVTDNVNQQKSDQDPASWRPPREQVWCAYARAWIEVKFVWRLTVDAAEKRTLSAMLNRC